MELTDIAAKIDNHEARSNARSEAIKKHIDLKLSELSELEKMAVEDKINIHTGGDSMAALAPLLAMIGGKGGNMSALAPLLANQGGLGGNSIVTGLILGALLGRGGLGGLFGGGDGAGVSGLNNLAQNMDTNAIMQALGDIKASVPLAESQVQLALAGAQSDITQQTQAQTQAITQQLFAGQLAQTQGFANVKDATDALSTQTAIGIGNIISNNDKNSWAISQAVVNDGDKTRALLVAQNEANLNRQLAVAEAALAEQRSVNRIYARNADEFTDGMTASVKLTDPKGELQESRIFSLRGCHLIAMFARTAIAKQFRKWVLDILDKEVSGGKTPYQMPLPTMSDKRTRIPLKDAVTLLVAKSRNMSYSDAYSLIHQRFNVDSVDDLTNEQLPQVVEYVHKVIGEFIGKDALPAPKPVLIADFPKKCVFEHKFPQRHLLTLDVFYDGYGLQGNPLRRLFALLKQAQKDGSTVAVNDIQGAELVLGVTEDIARQYKNALEQLSRNALSNSKQGCYLPMQGC